MRQTMWSSSASQNRGTGTGADQRNIVVRLHVTAHEQSILHHSHLFIEINLFLGSWHIILKIKHIKNMSNCVVVQ